MRRLLAVCTAVTAATFALVGPAQAVTLVNPDGTPVGGQWQQWADDMHVSTVSWLTLHIAPCPGWGGDAAGCTTGASDIYISPADIAGVGSSFRRDLLYHELGHAFDFGRMTDAARLAFMQIWRVPQLANLDIESNWFYGVDQLDNTFDNERMPASEWFAEAYRLCALYAHWNTNAADAEQNTGWSTNGQFAGFQYNYPAAWSTYARDNGGRIPHSLHRWALAAQRATCRIIRSS